jgi:hypothetical protein
VGNDLFISQDEPFLSFDGERFTKGVQVVEVRDILEDTLHNVIAPTGSGHQEEDPVVGVVALIYQLDLALISETCVILAALEEERHVCHVLERFYLQVVDDHLKLNHSVFLAALVD